MTTENVSYILLSDDRERELAQLAEKVGGSIHVIRKVRVRQNRNWEVVLIMAGSNANTHGSTAIMSQEVVDQYQPDSDVETELDIVLFNHPQYSCDLDKVTAWASEAGLKTANPRELFAGIGQSVDLPNSLGKDTNLYIVSPVICFYQAKPHVCCYYWSQWPFEDQGIGLARADTFDGPVVWFGFHE